MAGVPRSGHSESDVRGNESPAAAVDQRRSPEHSVVQEQLVLACSRPVIDTSVTAHGSYSSMTYGLGSLFPFCFSGVRISDPGSSAGATAPECRTGTAADYSPFFPAVFTRLPAHSFPTYDHRERVTTLIASAPAARNSMNAGGPRPLKSRTRRWNTMAPTK